MSMNQRVYTAFFDNVTVGTAVQDLLYLKAGAGSGIELHYISLTAGGVTSASEIRVRLKRGTGTVTAGSAGSALTPAALNSGDTKAVQATARSNDTTQATATTFTTLCVWQWNVLMPLEYFPAPEDRISCLASEGLVLDFPAVIAAATTCSLFAQWAEA